QDYAQRRPAEGRLLFPAGRALCRKAALQQLAGTQLRREDLPSRAEEEHFSRREAEEGPAGQREGGREVGERGGQGLRGGVQAPEVRAHGRGVVPPRLSVADDQEGRQGPGVLPPPHQGLPTVEVRPQRLPVLCRILLWQGRDGELAQV